MSERDSGPTAPHQPGVPPLQPYAPQPGVPPLQPPPATPPRRSRAWVWWTIGIVVLVGLLVVSCVLPVVLVSSRSMSASGLATDNRIAVIHVDGVISGTGDSYSGYVTPEAFWDTFEQAIDDRSVKAIVLRVDSPGGTVAASQEIANMVAQSDKPVIVSSGDVNASGAYMVSSQADQIWALPGTSVGSIGVIAQIPNVSGLLDKVGVEFAVITAGEDKDAGSPFRPLADEERALIQGEVDEVYDQFIDLVAEGRDMKRSEVESLATGWAWNGERAKELGLVDEIGTYPDALDAAAKAGGITGDYDVVSYEDDFGKLLDSLIGLSSGLQRLATAVSAPVAPDVRGALPR